MDAGCPDKKMVHATRTHTEQGLEIEPQVAHLHLVGAIEYQDNAVIHIHF